MLFNANNTTYTKVIDTIFNKGKKYNKIYMSVGSKYNQTDVMFYSKNMPLAQMRSTNASYQMIPEFLRHSLPDTNILIIMVDIFNQGANFDYNKELLLSKSTKNMDILMINMDCCDPKFVDMCTLILSNIKIQNISPSSFMICNFIKHMNSPNENEYNAELTVVRSMLKVLNTYDFKWYLDCFYQWYGYKYHIFNFIYKHSISNYDLYFAKTVTDLNNEIYKSSRMVVNNIKNSKFDKMLANTYDITVSYDVHEYETLSLPISVIYGTG